MRLLTTIATLAFLIVPNVAAAQDADAAAKALQEANDAMMAGMHMLPNTGSPDRDFVLMMIPHHEGAVAMAKVLLKYGSDPELRKLAEAIVASQSEEIAFMHDWLEKHPQ